jgi:hypothetical protein
MISWNEILNHRQKPTDCEAVPKLIDLIRTVSKGLSNPSNTARAHEKAIPILGKETQVSFSNSKQTRAMGLNNC